ncbi:glycine cleavage system H protein [Paenibacillus sp. UNCCL117]|uniref:glycine cleavage system protein GcvH n=1 Tax=unclassified Paenibacillus TaxID=185978 RepID=UPI00088BB285|nr:MULTISPECIES: glycine cleavage system protein GcvH [unclassified Paenibacillus]SDE22372.1 glycine cleavage system H protein [Paenibacillus sp. cl123]SFW42983.1 glycine cleavage system H protein [Paenibacillus sp. UNCCL117]
MEIVQEYKYSEGHIWVRIDGNRATIGLTDFAQEEFGIIVFIELPEVGEKLTAGEPLGSMESVKTVTELYAPLSGQVLDINRELGSNPGLINMSPYHKGWILTMALEDPSELDGLWDAARYEQTYAHE